MKWVTREKVKVDRVACPWLIRKFIDPQAEFLFVPADQVMDVAKREDATPYDVKGMEFGHHDKECSFDALVKHDLTRDPRYRSYGQDRQRYREPEQRFGTAHTSIAVHCGGSQRIARVTPEQLG